MTIRKSLLLAALCALPSWLQAASLVQTVRLEAATQVRLDGHFYPIAAGDIVLQSDGGYYAQQTVSMANCHRPSGDQIASSLQFRWTSGLRTVYLGPDSPLLGSPVGLEYFDGAWTLTLRSTTGDVICDGEVGGGGGVFSNGFE